MCKFVIPPQEPQSPREQFWMWVVVSVFLTDLLAIALIGLQNWLEHL